MFSFSVGGDDSINTLVIFFATSGIFPWFTLCGMAYKSWHLNAIEVSFILNLAIGILATATHHVNQSGGSQAGVACISVGVALLTFVGIVIYHIQANQIKNARKSLVSVKKWNMPQKMWEQQQPKESRTSLWANCKEDYSHCSWSLWTVISTQFAWYQMYRSLNTCCWHAYKIHKDADTI